MYELFISGIFHLTFLDHSCPRVTETTESEITDAGRLLYNAHFGGVFLDLPQWPPVMTFAIFMCTTLIHTPDQVSHLATVFLSVFF